MVTRMTSEPLGPGARTPEEIRDRVLAQRRGVPFLLYRDGAGEQAVYELADDASA